MDIIQHCLSSTPVPHLASAFFTLKFIWSDVEQAQVSKQQLRVLVQSIAQLLHTLDTEYKAGRLLHVRTSVHLADLCRFVSFNNAIGNNQ